MIPVVATAAGAFFLNKLMMASKQKSLRDNIEELKSLNARLDQLITRIGDSWDGEASEAFVNSMKAYAVKGQEMQAVLEEYDRYANSATEFFQNMDRESASEIRNAF